MFDDFERIARSEADEKITQDEVEELKISIGDKKLWEIMPSYHFPIFFLYTEKQVKSYKSSEKIKEWSNKYFEMLKKYDEFGYYKKDSFSIKLDSKENFDKNYKSNWYYYFK